MQEGGQVEHRAFFVLILSYLDPNKLGDFVGFLDGGQVNVNKLAI